MAWRPLILLFGVMASFFFSISMFIPILPLYVEDLGGSAFEVGLVVGAFSLGVLIVRPIVGRLIDTRGRRSVLALGGLIAAAMAPLYVLLTPLLLLVVVRVVHGVGLSAHTGAATTLVADSSPPERRTEFMGYFSAASILALAIAAPLAVALTNHVGYSAVFLTAGVFAAASAVGAKALEEPPRSHAVAISGDYRAAIARRHVLVPSVTLFFATLTMGAMLAFLPLLLEQRRPTDFGWFFVANAVAALAARVLAGRVARRAGDGTLVLFGLIVHAAGLAALPLIHSFTSMIAVAVLAAVGFAAFWPGLYGLVANAAPDRARGMVLNVFLAAFDLGMLVGGLSSGPVVERIGIPGMLTALAAVPVGAALLFLLTMGWRPVAATALLVAVATPLAAQQSAGVGSVPHEVRFAALAADAILSSEPATVSLEAFSDDTVTGVYLRGTLEDEPESVAYGRDPSGRRYLWFSIPHGLNIEYVVMLFDVDLDLQPDFLLFRTIDRKRNLEYATEYRGPQAADEPFDISFQPACKPPACDPAFWTIGPRQEIDVADDWFAIWRSVIGVAATRGEGWLGKPKRLFEATEPSSAP